MGVSGHFDALVVNGGSSCAAGSVDEVWCSSGGGSKHCAAGSVDDDVWSKPLDLPSRSSNMFDKNRTSSVHATSVHASPVISIPIPVILPSSVAISILIEQHLRRIY